MRILALIPARGGSKRLPGKNIMSFGDKPLINWSIEVAKGIPEICEILVSTDDPGIASVAKAAGANVPWLRPNLLSTDHASAVDVALHALGWYEIHYGAVDGLLLLQPTSPFRTKETINRGIELFRKFGNHSVLGVSPSQSHPLWSYKQEGNFIVPFMEDPKVNARSQDLLPAYNVNGAFYLVSPENLRKEHSFGGLKSIPLHISSMKEAIDIDSLWDFELALYMLKRDY